MSRTVLVLVQSAAAVAICCCVEGYVRLAIVGVACAVLGLANYAEGARFGR